MLRGFFIAILIFSAAVQAEVPTNTRGPSAPDRTRQSQSQFFNQFSQGRARRLPRTRIARPPQKAKIDVNFDFLKSLGGAGLDFGSGTASELGGASASVGGAASTGGDTSGKIGFSPDSQSSSSAANGGGAGAASGGSSPQLNSVGFNDAAPEDRDSVELRGSENGRNGPSLGPGEGTGSAESVAHPVFKPVCFLIDPANNATANGVIKDFVDAYASCGVTAVPFAFTIKQNYPVDKPDIINEMAKQVCPLSSVLGVAESSIQTHVSSDITTDIMCDSWEDKAKGIPTKNVAGCAVFVPPRHFTPDPKKSKDFSKNSSKHFGGAGSDGKDAVSIVDVGQSSMVAIHEVQHNNGGVNVGEGDGEKPHGYGIESVGKEPNQAPSGEVFTAEGCAHIRSAANPNDGTFRYSPSKTVYYTPIDNPRYQRDLMAGRSFFDSGAGPPPLAPIPSNKVGDLPLATAPQGKQEIVAGPPSKHKKKPNGGSAPVVRNEGGGKPSSLTNSNSFFSSAGSAPERGGEDGANKIGFNDKADASSEALSEDFFGDGKTKRVGFNDKAPEEGAIEENFFKGGSAPGGEAPGGDVAGGEAPGGEAPGGTVPGADPASRLLSSLDGKNGKKDQESQLDENFFEEEQRKKKAQSRDPNAYDSSIQQSGFTPSKAPDIGALSSDTSLFSAESTLFEKGQSFIESVADKVGEIFNDSYFQGVRGEGQKKENQPQERVRIIRTEDIY